MNDSLPKYVKKEIDEMRIPNDKLDLAIENGIKKGLKKKWGINKKIVYLSSAAVIMFGLFISSAFVSPTMAKIVGEIPYLGQIFKSNNIITIIGEKLKEQGYHISSIGIGYQPKKTVEVYIEGSDYYNEVKDDVEKTIKQILNSKGYDAYSVKVKKLIPKGDYVLNEEEVKEKNTLEKQVTEKLKQLNYKFDMVQVDPTEKTIIINISGSKKYYNSIQNAVKKVATEIFNENKYTGYKVNLTRVMVTITEVDKGAQITPAIAEGLMSKKKFKVTGVSYKSKPLSFIIKTSISSSEPSAKQLGTEIESMIVEFLTSKEISPILDNESYEVIVKSKDNKKIN